MTTVKQHFVIGQCVTLRLTDIVLSILFRVNIMILTQAVYSALQILRVAGVRVSATRTVSGRLSRRAVGPLLRFNIVTRAPLVNSDHLLSPRATRLTHSLTTFQKGPTAVYRYSNRQYGYHGLGQ